MNHVPVDFSFKELVLVTEILTEEPNPREHEPEKNIEGKFTSQVLRLNNNQIKETNGLIDVLHTLFAEPMRLVWLDLSFNLILHIPLALTELMELQILYLHGNSINDISEVDKLGVLPCLHTITLHGNGMENTPGYRRYMIATLSCLKMMDFSAVTKQERVMASIWHKDGKNRRRSNAKSKD